MLTLRGCAALRAFWRRPELDGASRPLHRAGSWQPSFFREVGGRVVYALDDLKAWADLGAKTSTSDPGVATVFPAKPILGSAMGRSHRA
jgi:hypothetical protein